MSALYPDGRQYPLVAESVIGFADILTTAVPVTVMELPQNSVITSIVLYVDTAFSGATSADLDIGDNTDPNRYSQTICEIDAGGIPVNAPAADYYQTLAADSNIIVTPTLVGAAISAGSARLIVEYFVSGRHNENQG